MFNTVTVEVEVDLSDIENDVFEYAEQNGYVKVDETIDKYDIEEIINDIEKELYIYTTKSMTLEDVLRRLKELI